MIDIQKFYNFGFNEYKNLVIDYKNPNMRIARLIASLDSVYTDSINCVNDVERIRVLEANLFNDINNKAFLFDSNKINQLHLDSTVSMSFESKSLTCKNYKILRDAFIDSFKKTKKEFNEVLKNFKDLLFKNHYNPNKLYTITISDNNLYKLEFDLSDYKESRKIDFVNYVKTLQDLIFNKVINNWNCSVDSLMISLSIEHPNIEDFLDMKDVRKKVLITKNFLDKLTKIKSSDNNNQYSKIWNKLVDCIYNEGLCVTVIDNIDSYIPFNSINKATGYINLSTLVDQDKKTFNFIELTRLIKRSTYYLDILTELYENNNDVDSLRDIQLDLIGFEEVIKLMDINSDIFATLCNDIYKYVAINSLEASINIVTIFGKSSHYYSEILDDFNTKYYFNMSVKNADNSYHLMHTYKDELPSKLINFLDKVYIHSPMTFEYIFDNLMKNNVRNSKRIASTHSGCQVKNTYINTSKGLLRLDEIGNINNTEQWSNIDINIEQEQNCTKSDKFYINGLQNTKKITLSSGIDLECTLNHQYRILDENDQYVWRQADQLKKGDRIVYKIGEYTNTENLTFDFGDFKKNANQSNDITFPNQMNEDLAYFIGVYSDKGHKDKSRLNIPFVKKDIEKYNKFKEVVKRLFNYDLKVDDSKRDNTIITYLYSSEVIQKLERIGALKSNPKVLSIPRVIRQSSKSCIEAFIEGYRSTDKTNKYINTSSYQFAKELLILMRMIGINGHVYKFSHFRDNEVKYVLYRVTIGGYSSDDFGEDKIKFMSKEIKKDHNLLLSYGNKLYTDKIIDIEDSQNYTYDIQVPINNTYIANSYISHNTISELCDIVNTDDASFKYDNDYVDEVVDRRIKLCNIPKDSLCDILENSYEKVNEIYFEPCNDHNDSCDIKEDNTLEEILRNSKTEELVEILRNDKHIYNKLFASFVSSGRANSIIREDSEDDVKPLYGIGSFITCNTPYGLLNISSKFDSMDRMKEIMIMFNHPDSSFKNLIDTLVITISNILQENYDYKIRYNKLIYSLRYKYAGLNFEYNSVIQNDTKITVYSIPDLLSYVIPDMEYLYLLNKYGTREEVNNRMLAQ